ncbi:hypothetical protein DENSPDRAFT_64625 [Dentipellis sp. KUC8613]|nr:hypothetical protein DENSPDRAFT_64625 [Dentipellis sp. KUC8613]
MWILCILKGLWHTQDVLTISWMKSYTILSMALFLSLHAAALGKGDFSSWTRLTCIQYYSSAPTPVYRFLSAQLIDNLISTCLINNSAAHCPFRKSAHLGETLGPVSAGLFTERRDIGLSMAIISL